MTPTDLGPTGTQDPFQLFTYLVETGGRILVTSDQGNGPFIRFGYEVEVYQKDLRMLGTAKESLDAIWWSSANQKYSIEDTFRVLQSMFKTLKPKKGVLALSFVKDSFLEKESLENQWNIRTVMTLLRQTGFQLFHTFENKEEHLYFAQRV